MEKHYYLINNEVKVSDSKMPELKIYRQTMGSVVYEARHKRDYNNWLSSLQPCEIDDSELDKVINYTLLNGEKGTIHRDGIFIEITDIVEEKDYSSSEPKPKIYFKQPKQVDINEIADLKSLMEYHLDQYESAKIRLDELQPKQVESECEAVMIELIKPYMYCYMGSGMLTNEYDESVAIMMAKNTLNALKPYLK